ncbi:MAG: 2-hydroxymuconate tautomerase, partial [Natronospirillum sp.]
MPIAHINILEGRSDEQKRDLISKVTDAISESLGSARDNVRITITEVP